MSKVNATSKRSLPALMDYMVDTLGSLKIEKSKDGELQEIKSLSHNGVRRMATWIESMAIVSYIASSSELKHENLVLSLGVVADIMGEMAVLRDVLMDLEKEATDILNRGDK